MNESSNILEVEVLKKMNHPISFFVYEDDERKVFRGVCLPFFLTIERDTKEEAKRGIIERFHDFLSIAKANNLDVNEMYQTPEYELDFMIAKNTTHLLEQFEKELITRLEAEVKKKSLEKKKKKITGHILKKEKSHKRPIWSEVGEASMFANSVC